MSNSNSDLLICSLLPISDVDSSIIASKGYQYYYDIWKYIAYHNVKWYEIRLPEDDFGGTSLVNDYEEELYKIHQPIFFLSESYNYATKFKVNSTYFSLLIDCLKEILLSSKIKTVFFLVRYQSPDIELVQGVYSFSKFKEKLLNNELFSNICYVVSLKGEEPHE